MKRKIITIGVLIMVSIFITGCFNKQIKIENTKRFIFSEIVGNYMNGNIIYELHLEDNKYILSYKPNMAPEEEKLQKEITKEQVIQLENIMNKYNISKWNGFQKADKHVLDGRSFDLVYEREDGAYISASGYMKYPKGYKEFKEEVRQFYLNIFKEELTDEEI